MLKWTVHKRPESAGGSGVASTMSTLVLGSSNSNDSNKNSKIHSRRSLGNLSRPMRTARDVRQQECRRKSLGSSEITRRIQNRDKENQHVLTPHPYTLRQNVTSTPVVAFGGNSKLEFALRDVRNLTPKQQQTNSGSIASLINAVTPSRKRPLAKTPPPTPSLSPLLNDNMEKDVLSLPSTKIEIDPMRPAMISTPTPYASTLPTFDIEYSPCAASAQTLHAPTTVNSITVSDSYFNQPRYFQEPLPASKRLKFSPSGMTPLSSRLAELRFSKLSFKRKSLQNGKKLNESVSNKSAMKSIETDELASNGIEGSNRNVDNNNDINKNNNHCASDLQKKSNESKSNNIKQLNPSIETSLSSTALDDTALDKMIDAILESARKERPSIVRNLASRKVHKFNQISTNFLQMSSDSPTYTAAEDPASDLNKFCDNFLISPDKLIAAGERTIILEETHLVNEREIRTPEPLDAKRFKANNKQQLNGGTIANSCHLRRQRAVRRKHTKCDHHQQKQQQQQQQQPIASSSSSSILKPEFTQFSSSPKTPSDSNFGTSSFLKKTNDELANMNTPIIDIDSGGIYAQRLNYGAVTSITSKISSDSTPGIHTNDLQASSTPTNASSDLAPSIRRCLTFLDSPVGGTSTTDDSMEKRKSTASSTVSMASTSTLSSSARTTAVSGSLDLAIFCENNKLNIHVIRCRDLSQTNGGAVNAYVKVALLFDDSSNDIGYQRTAVHRNSQRPFFDHRFVFDMITDVSARIQLAVWHRDREFKRSDFLGCMSFPVKTVTSSKEINGSFKLQPKSCLTIPTPPIAMCENSQSSVDEAINTEDPLGIAPISSTSVATATSDAIGSITLSKKAIHQRDADENLFLRFLELDPPIESTTTTASAPQTGELRRKSTLKSSSSSKDQTPTATTSTAKQNQNGRTPFTITKKLIRTADKGFGFSIVWTHPPRIEKVEPGLSADRCGIYPGDYVIFVDKHNVVTMPEMDILNLIKSQGNTLVLEIFRRSVASRPQSNGIKSRVSSVTTASTGAAAANNNHILSNSNNVNASCTAVSCNNNNDDQTSEFATPKQSTSSLVAPARPITACSNVSLSLESTKRRLHLPQVTFSKESTTTTAEDAPRKYLYQLINREQHFVTALQYGVQRFTSALQERRDLISPTDHRTLFQNIEEILRLSEDILEQLIPDEHEPQLLFASRVYLSKSTAFCAAYKRYCNGLKRADCVLVNKSRQSNSDFVTFITVPQVPRKRPDLTTFIHRPLQHFREVLKLIIMIASHCRPDAEECKNFTHVIAALQTSYREITVGEGLMGPLGEGRPLLTLQDLEARLVFTKCKPFVLAVPGRQWIFGGDLSRVEGRSVKPYWSLLFSDILLFAKVSRDRVLFITEEPLPLANIVDSCFNIRKKHTEFRITIDPNGRLAESPTVHCTPDLSRTPRKSARKHTIILRTPSPELKAVWQNLLQRQVFLVNATLGSTLSSPLESPDILQRFMPASDVNVGAVTTSMASIKLSADSINTKSQQSQSSHVSKQVEEFIDEKCRLLNKNGTSHGSALHLAQWMKGQFDDSIKKLTEENNAEETMSEDDEPMIEVWSHEQLRKRSQELQLLDENGQCMAQILDINNRHSSDKGYLAVEDGGAFASGELDDGSKSASTTSDSQITVRSSPITKKVDKLSVCRHCHKNCKLKIRSHSKTNSLKVQHSQSSSSRCCASTNSSQGSGRSTSSRASTNSKSKQLLTNKSHTSLSPLANRSCSRKSHRSHDGSPVSNKTITTTTCSNNNNTPCSCKCTDADFQDNIRMPHEVKKETCKLLDNVSELQSVRNATCNWTHANRNFSSETILIRESKIENFNENGIVSTSEVSNVDDWSTMLVGWSQFHPIPITMQDPFKAVPKISVVPPTPDGGVNAIRKNHSQIWEKPSIDSIDGTQQSQVDSQQDDELPYRSLNTTLKRFGTMSSLEKMPSDEADDKTYDSSETEENDDESNKDIKIVTKEVYDNNMRNWTDRAGTFFEQSRAFLDSYLGRWDRGNEMINDDVEDILAENGEDCTSGGTSGEEVWGTPTSGENDEIQMFNSDQTHSSSTKSSSSLTGDDDTELMMDELLMAPPMTASTIRGLLPRRRLEPLFEEDTESSSDSDEDDEDEDDQENDGLPPDLSSSDQGQVQKICMQNGHDVVIDVDNEKNKNSTLFTISGNIATTTSTRQSIAELSKQVVDGGNNADVGFFPAQKARGVTTTAVYDEEKKVKFVCGIDHVVESFNVPSLAGTAFANTTQTQIRLSPRLEMRLALNHDIMGDEDLISFEPGPANLAAILGRDLSSYHRFTGRDLISRSASRIVPKEAAHISFSQQKNSKMDTPTPNRKKSNPSTWNNSAYVAAAIETKMTDLERLARTEKKHCQMKSYQAGHQCTNRTVRVACNTAKSNEKSKKFFNFLKKRNNEQCTSNGKLPLTNTTLSSSEQILLTSRKDADKSLDRRFWKQLTKRRRSLHISEITSY